MGPYGRLLPRLLLAAALALPAARAGAAAAVAPAHPLVSSVRAFFASPRPDVEWLERSLVSLRQPGVREALAPQLGVVARAAEGVVLESAGRPLVAEEERQARRGRLAGLALLSAHLPGRLQERTLALMHAEFGRDALEKAAAAAAALPEGASLVGAELEYTLAPSEDGDRRADAATVSSVLQRAGAPLGLGPIRIGASPKFENTEYEALAEDPRGGTWVAMPEKLDGIVPGGVELVSPPMDAEGLRRLGEGHARVLSGGLARRDVETSSMHLTYDVSSLVDADGDASRLVDAILHLESRWARVYAALSPTRYGTLVNRYGVPLAVRHPGLLRELAALPREARDFEAVRAVFRRHDAAEQAAAGVPAAAWKFLAANYGKLFGLQEGYARAPLLVIEVRMPDLPGLEGPLPAHDLLSAVLFRAPPMDRFEPDLPAGASIPELNAAILGQDREGYEAFIAGLGLDPAGYGFLEALRDRDGEVASPLAAATLRFFGREHSIPELLAASDPRRLALGVEALQAAPDAEFAAEVRRLLHHPLKAARYSAMSLVALRGHPELHEVLALAARDASELVRKMAAVLSTRLEEGAAVALIERLARDEAELPSAWAWWAAERVDSPRLLPLIQAGMRSRDQATRGRAWRALGGQASPESAALLAQLARPDQPGPIRTAAAELLRRHPAAAAAAR